MWENSTSEDLELLSSAVLENAPCALEMPAGTGKTHLLAKTVFAAHAEGTRSLILTHTNAGVDALKKRLKRFGVPSSAFRVDTITGFAFSLARAYATIGDVTVPATPDWTESDSYIQGAIRVANAASIRTMLASSFEYFFVDEYQDCNIRHHELVGVISVSIPKTVVLGDRLQGIFGFAGERLVDWDTDVIPSFPILPVSHTPHRWREVNPELGSWLQAIRPSMSSGVTLDLQTIQVPGVEWLQSGDGVLANKAFSFNDYSETVLLLDKWPASVADHASRLGGTYVVMEDIRGRFMHDELSLLPQSDSSALAHWLTRFAKKCMAGLAGIDAPVLQKLQNDQSITHYQRDGIADILVALDGLRQAPSYAALCSVAEKLSEHSVTKLYRWEAWRDTLAAIRNSKDGETSPLDELAVIRDKIRHTGRRQHARVASRTVLVKGLEYDHVIIADASNLLDPKNLYVALTRARKTITIISSSRYLRLADD
jgi:hypothetical protein